MSRTQWFKNGFSRPDGRLMFDEFLYPDAAAGRLFLVIMCPDASPEVACGLLEAPMAFNVVQLTPAVVDDLPAALDALVPVTWTPALDGTHGLSKAPATVLEVNRTLVERLTDSLLLTPRRKWRTWQGLASDPRGDRIVFGYDDATQTLYELHGGVRRPLALEGSRFSRRQTVRRVCAVRASNKAISALDVSIFSMGSGVRRCSRGASARRASGAARRRARLRSRNFARVGISRFARYVVPRGLAEIKRDTNDGRLSRIDS